MSPAPVRSGRIGLIVAIGLIAVLIGVGAIVLAVNPPFQGSARPTPTVSPSVSASVSPSPSATPSATPSPSPSPSATPTETPTVAPTPTGDPVPDDSSFRDAVRPYLTDAEIGLTMVEDTVDGGSFDNTQDIVQSLLHDVQRLLDNPKPSDSNTWKGAVESYGAAIESLNQALGNGDGDRTRNAIDSARRDLASLVELAS